MLINNVQYETECKVCGGINCIYFKIQTVDTVGIDKKEDEVEDEA